MSEERGGGVSFTWILEWYHTIKFDIRLNWIKRGQLGLGRGKHSTECHPSV